MQQHRHSQWYIRTAAILIIFITLKSPHSTVHVGCVIGKIWLASILGGGGEYFSKCLVRWFSTMDPIGSREKRDAKCLKELNKTVLWTIWRTLCPTDSVESGNQIRSKISKTEIITAEPYKYMPKYLTLVVYVHMVARFHGESI